MRKYSVASLLVFFLSLTSLFPSLACSIQNSTTPLQSFHYLLLHHPSQSHAHDHQPKPVPCPPPPKLSACVDLLGGLVHIGIRPNAKDTCFPVLDGLVDLDAALCLCTTIKAKLLSIKILLPIALELLVDCGKHPPKGYQCSSAFD